MLKKEYLSVLMLQFCGNKVGSYSLIGAGAVITKNVKPHSIMVGNPAKQIAGFHTVGKNLIKFKMST